MDLSHSGSVSPATALDSPSQPNRKRKSQSAGSRGVASLTPDQLAKKRANDREAQRAIRERTKQQIENLERRIQDLTSQQPYQELQAVIRQKDAIQAENEEIRRRLASIMSILQPIVGAQGLTATATQHNVHTAFQPDSYTNGQQRRPYASAQPQQDEPTSYPPFNHEDTSDGNQVWHNQRAALQTQRDNLQRGLELDDSGERLSFNFLLDGLANGAPNESRATHTPVQSNPHLSPDQRSPYPSLAGSYSEPQKPAWAVLSKTIEPTCPYDSILLNFIRSRQSNMSHNGRHHRSSEPDPPHPSLSSLLNPAGHHKVDQLSQLMTDIVSKFPTISGLPEQAAVLFMMFVSTRWFINPTQENYERIPEWMTPRPSQLFTPHPIWLDHIPWPRMRDKMVANYHDYPFENWFIPFTSGLSVNWPYDPVDCLLQTPDHADPMMNPVFEKHIRRLENWSLSPHWAETFPALADTARIREVEPRKLTSQTV